MGGECRLFERPAYVILGKTQPDQDWIDSNIEGGVGGCGWKRPLPRPPEWDAAPAPRPAVAAKQQRVGIVTRIKARLKPAKAAPLPLAPPIGVKLAPPPPPPPAPEPIDPVDELLGTQRSH